MIHCTKLVFWFETFTQQQSNMASWEYKRRHGMFKDWWKLGSLRTREGIASRFRRYYTGWGKPASSTPDPRWSDLSSWAPISCTNTKGIYCSRHYLLKGEAEFEIYICTRASEKLLYNSGTICNRFSEHVSRSHVTRVLVTWLVLPTTTGPLQQNVSSNHDLLDLDNYSAPLCSIRSSPDWFIDISWTNQRTVFGPKRALNQ